jgi:phosphatidate cytidylyltransferase
VVAVALAVVLAAAGVVPQSDVISALLVTVLLSLSLLMLLAASALRRSFTQWAWSIAGALYVGWMLGHWGRLYVLPSGRDLVVFGMFVTFFYDTFAYFVGRAIGRHKLAPRLSAKKTWEGAVGGLVMAIVGGLLIRFAYLRLCGGFPLPLSFVVPASVLIAVAAQTGDLVESALKRSAGAKDSGGILPGHGGMLDRFDSLLFTGPMLYYLVVLVAI